MPKSVSFSKGSIIFFKGDKDEFIYILQSGGIMLKGTNLETGAEEIEALHSGEFFGVKSALSKMPSSVTAVAAMDSVVIQLTVTEFEQVFSSKTAVTEKMMRVFSKNLKSIHRQMEEFLNNAPKKTNPDEGMTLVAKAFFNEGEYVSCRSILKRLLSKIPYVANHDELEKLDQEAAKKHNETPALPNEEPEQESEQKLSTPNQFNLPIFDRFTKKYANGEVIISEFEPGETFYLIKSGQVQIVKCIGDKIKSLDILKQGELFGEMAILDNSQRSATCLAKGPVSCLEFNKENFKALVLANPQIVMNLLKLLCKRICDQERRFRIILIKDIRARIADIFLMYNEIYFGSMKDERNSQRSFFMTASDIAGWAACPINQVKDELNKLISKNKIQMFDDRIVVINIHDMKRIVDTYYNNINSDLKTTAGKPLGKAPAARERPATLSDTQQS